MGVKLPKDVKPGAVVFVDGDDWEGLYIDGNLKAEGHSLQIDDVLKILRIPSVRAFADISWLEDRGNLPSKLSEVEFEK